MSFDDLQNQWQSHDHGTRLNLDANLLLKEVRCNHQAMERSLFGRDLVEVVAAAFVTLFFGYSAKSQNEWPMYVIALGGLFVGVFLVVDRTIQRRRRPVSDDSLQSCIQASLVQVNHQIWLLRNIVWWYLLPLAVGMVLLHGSRAWKARDAGLMPQIGLVIAVLVCLLLFWGVYWLNQQAVKKMFEPRREELESLLASLKQ